MRAIPQEALNRTPLRIWLIILLTPIIGAATYLTIRNPLLKQLEAGINNFLYLGFFCVVLLVLNLFMFFLFIKLISSYSTQVLAGELNNTPSLYTAQNGLSCKFIQKYNLSKRQVEIVEALLKGKSNKEIAILMDIKVNTVQVHLQKIYQKTGAPSRYAIMALIGIGLGIGYDFDINQYFTVGGYINLVSNFANTLSCNFILTGKYYPIKTEAGNPYIDLGLGYRRRKSDYDGSTDNIHCLVGLSHIGWKFNFNNGLILDPTFGIRYDIATFSGDENFKFGFNIKAIVVWMF